LADELSCFALPNGALPDWAERLRRYARFPAPLLLHGESGVGKTMLADVVHRLSGRRGRFEVLPLHAGSTDLVRDDLFGHVDGAFTGARGTRKGLLHEVSDGTLLIDEIGDASPDIQAMLLPMLDTTPVGVRKVGCDRAFVPSVRFVLATLIDLEERVREGRFRPDLLHRICGLTVRVPPLRERPHEIVPHAEQVLRRLDRECPSSSGEPYCLTRDSWQRMLAYHWPGNLRELSTSVQAAVAMANGSALVEILELAPFLGEGGATASHPRERLERVLREQGGNVSRAAMVLGVGRTTFYKLCEQAGVDLRAFRAQ
jgi:DNA-binding NtrC family response regulator